MGDINAERKLNHALEIKCMTRNFIAYLWGFDIELGPGRMKVDGVPEEDAVYPGFKIFEFFFEGTKFKSYKDYEGPEDFEGIKPGNFGHWMYIFDKIVAELTEKQNSRPAIERWWDAVKKVIILYRSVSEHKKCRKVRE